MTESRERPERGEEGAPAAPVDPRTQRSAGRDPMGDVASRPGEEDAPPEALRAGGPAGGMPVEPAGEDASDEQPPAPPGGDVAPGAHVPRTPPRARTEGEADDPGRPAPPREAEDADERPERPITQWPDERRPDAPAADQPPG